MFLYISFPFLFFPSDSVCRLILGPLGGAKRSTSPARWGENRAGHNDPLVIQTTWFIFESHTRCSHSCSKCWILILREDAAYRRQMKSFCILTVLIRPCDATASPLLSRRPEMSIKIHKLTSLESQYSSIVWFTAHHNFPLSYTEPWSSPSVHPRHKQEV